MIPRENSTITKSASFQHIEFFVPLSAILSCILVRFLETLLEFKSSVEHRLVHFQYETGVIMEQWNRAIGHLGSTLSSMQSYL